MAMFRRLSLLVIILIALPGAAPAADIQGQKPVMFIGDAFQFVPGAWTSYYVHDKQKNEHYRMWMATLEKRSQDNKPASWMEIEVVMEKNPPVVTRFLVEETPRGPGELMEVIVQMKGYSPFVVPKKYYEGTDKEVGQFQTAQTVKRVAQRVIRFAQRDLKVVEVEAVDPTGKRVAATVSESVLPIGVVMAETDDVGMYLDNWGMQAKSKIEGTPMNFYLWLMMQIGDGLTK
jgi:hypothetical protein